MEALPKCAKAHGSPLAELGVGLGQGGLRGHHAGMPGPGSLSEPAIWPCVLGPRLVAKQKPGAGSLALQALHKAICQRCFPKAPSKELPLEKLAWAAARQRRLGALGKSANHPEIKSPLLVVPAPLCQVSQPRGSRDGAQAGLSSPDDGMGVGADHRRAG